MSAQDYFKSGKFSSADEREIIITFSRANRERTEISRFFFAVLRSKFVIAQMSLKIIRMHLTRLVFHVNTYRCGKLSKISQLFFVFYVQYSTFGIGFQYRRTFLC